MHINQKEIAGKLLVLVLGLLCFTNCRKRKKEIRWESVRIDSQIAKEPIYAQLDSQKEVSQFEIDSSLKRSSDVAYFDGEKLDTNSASFSKYYQCRAFIYYPDTLIINIGFGNGFVSQGFTIYYKNPMFYINPYYSDDVIMPGERDADYKILYQRLTLDKSNYKNGDSLFGRVEFRSVGSDMYNQKSEQYGIGNFRAKVGYR